MANNNDFDRMVKEDADKSSSVFHNIDLLILMNGSPEYQNGGVINLYNNASYVIVDNKIRSTEEFKINNDIYRYLTSKTPFPQRDAELFPIICIDGTWRFEEETSPCVTRELLNFINGDNQLKQRLMSKDITHSGFSLSSLLKQKNLAKIFIHDDYVKSLFILYNQQAINAIIRDLAWSEEQEAFSIPTA